jgi:hypothetical protein
VTVTAILAQEEHPPRGEKPIQWILLTNRTVQTLEQAQQMLDWYLCRWQIDIDQPLCLLKSLFALVEQLNDLPRPASWRIAQRA